MAELPKGYAGVMRPSWKKAYLMLMKEYELSELEDLQRHLSREGRSRNFSPQDKLDAERITAKRIQKDRDYWKTQPEEKLGKTYKSWMKSKKPIRRQTILTGLNANAKKT